MYGKSELLRMSAFLAALILAVAPAGAQGVTLPPDYVPGVPLNWVSVGTARDQEHGEMQVYYSKHMALSPRDMMVAIALVYSSPRLSATSETYWGEFVLDRIDCDSYSDLVPNDRILFDQQGRKLEYKIDPKGNAIYPSGRGPIAANSLHWERIALGSPVEAVFKLICQ